jgi:hypothetical protein
MNTMKKLRDALQDVTYQNAFLVMNNNELSLESSFMTPTQRETFKKIKAEQSRYYMQQREKPHYIEAYPEATILFKPHEAQQKPCATYADTEELLKEVDEVLRTKATKRDNLVLTPTTGDNTADSTAPPPVGRGKGKRQGYVLPQDRPSSNKYSRTDSTPIQESSSVENTGKGKGKGKGKWSNLAQEYVYWEPQGKGKGKGKEYAIGHRYNGNIAGPIGEQTPSNVPSLSEEPITIFNIVHLEFPGTEECKLIKTVPYKTPVLSRYMHQPIKTLPTKAFLKSRLGLPETEITGKHQEVYLNALECIRLLIQSPYERVIQDRETAGWINCEGKFVLPHDQHLYTAPHGLPPDLARYGDLVRVLRLRPTVHTKYGPKQDVLEYIPNDLYTWSFVKNTMRSYCFDKVSGSRFWNDQYVRPDTVSTKTLYSLHDHCPGMPVDLDSECEEMNLHPFVWNEIVNGPQGPKDKHPPIDPDGSIKSMIEKGIIEDGEITTIETFLKELKPIQHRYEMLMENWPFEIGRFVLSIHVQRLIILAKALHLYIEKVTKQLAAQALALAQSGGQNGAPNGNAPEQFRLDNSRDGGSQ